MANRAAVRIDRDIDASHVIRIRRGLRYSYE